MLVIACFLGITGVINGFAPPEDITYNIKINNLPKEAQGFKLIHLADLHISAPTTESEIEDIVKRTNAEDPDLIVITGDFIDGDIAFAGDQTNTGDRLFPSADCAKRNYRHFSSSSLITSYQKLRAAARHADAPHRHKPSAS